MSANDQVVIVGRFYFLRIDSLKWLYFSHYKNSRQNKDVRAFLINSNSSSMHLTNNPVRPQNDPGEFPDRKIFCISIFLDYDVSQHSFLIFWMISTTCTNCEFLDFSNKSLPLFPSPSLKTRIGR